MKRHILALLLLFLMAFPASAQDATPTPVGPRVDPLAANPANIQANTQATPTIPPRLVESDASDIFGILAGADPAINVVDTATAILRDTDGAAVGEALVLPLVDDLLVLQISAWALPPGLHGFHVHTVGACDATSVVPFSAAGSHLGSDDTDHPRHAGDLPALYVTASGVSGLAVVVDAFTLDTLLDADGSALIIHESADNYANIPERYGSPDDETLASGDSGARIACGVFEASRTALP